MSHQDSFDIIDQQREQARRLFVAASDALRMHIENLRKIGSVQSLNEAVLMYDILEGFLESRSLDLANFGTMLDVVKAIQTDFLASLREQVTLAERIESLEEQLAK